MLFAEEHENFVGADYIEIEIDAFPLQMFLCSSESASPLLPALSLCVCHGGKLFENYSCNDTFCSYCLWRKLSSYCSLWPTGGSCKRPWTLEVSPVSFRLTCYFYER